MNGFVLAAALLGQQYIAPRVQFRNLPPQLQRGIIQGNFPTPPPARMYRIPSTHSGFAKPQSAFPELLPINGDPQMYREPDPERLDLFNHLCLEHHNKIRKVAGSPRLQLRHALIDTAQEHAEYLAEHQTMDHFANGSPTERAARHGWMIRLWTTSEVLAMSYKNPAHAFQGWWNSPGHKRIIIDPHWQFAGYGFARDLNGIGYWVASVGATKRR